MGDDVVTSTEVLSICGVIMGFLLSGNIYFIKQVFDKVNATSATQVQQGVVITAIGTSVADIKGDMREFRTDLKSIGKLEKDVAVIQAQLSFNPQLSGTTKGTS